LRFFRFGATKSPEELDELLELELPEEFDELLELELLEEFDELLELELLEEFDELFELELLEEFEELFELELLDEFEELLELEFPATRVNSMTLVTSAFTSGMRSGWVAACAVPAASMAVPARAEILKNLFFMFLSFR
jgi:hypothetical protein